MTTSKHTGCLPSLSIVWFCSLKKSMLLDIHEIVNYIYIYMYVYVYMYVCMFDHHDWMMIINVIKQSHTNV
jgi:hypothetical protein